MEDRSKGRPFAPTPQQTHPHKPPFLPPPLSNRPTLGQLKSGDSKSPTRRPPALPAFYVRTLKCPPSWLTYPGNNSHPLLKVRPQNLKKSLILETLCCISRLDLFLYFCPLCFKLERVSLLFKLLFL